MPEVVEEGVTGYIVDGIEGAVRRGGSSRNARSAVIRQRFEERFSVERMAKDYLAVYHAMRQMIELPVYGRGADEHPAGRCDNAGGSGERAADAI